jgi:hypothetical protein
MRLRLLSLLPVALLAGSCILMASGPARADNNKPIIDFSATSSPTLQYTNSGSSATFTNAPNADILFTFLNKNGFDAKNTPISAYLILTSTITQNAYMSKGVDIQPLASLTGSFYQQGTNTLLMTFTATPNGTNDPTLVGTNGSHDMHLFGTTNPNGGTPLDVKLTSPWQRYNNSAFYTIDLSQLNVKTGLKGSYLDSFTASASGHFNSEGIPTPTPEPSPIVATVVLFGAVIFLVGLKARKSIAA